VAAGGIGDEREFAVALELGYAGVQMGTRFIATTECSAHDEYKQAIVRAKAENVVLTERLSGVPCSVIYTKTVARMGLRAGPIGRWMLRGRRTKHWMRTIYALRSLRSLKRASLEGTGYRDVWQAGKSVETINELLPAGEIVRRCAEAAGRHRLHPSAPVP